jgi:hypothetical protein
MKKRPNATPSGPAGHSRQAFQGGTYSLMLTAAVLALLITLTGQPTAEAGVDGAQLAADLPALLHGQGQHHGDCTRRLSDTALVKLFRLLRLARRLLDLEAGTTAPGT